jgi:hypothetical protein
MCRAVDCPLCTLKTWSGCGQHIDAALAPFKAEQRCKCGENGKPKPATACSIA